MDNIDDLNEDVSGKEMMTDEKREEMQQKTYELGSLLHDEWRESKKLEDGTLEPEILSTTDEKWIKKNGKDQVDIANTSYADLPEEWKGENRASAEVAMNLVYESAVQEKPLDDNFIEEASSKLHDAWLKRNVDSKEQDQDKSYTDLSEEEKEKDRAIIKKAIEIYNQNK